MNLKFLILAFIFVQCESKSQTSTIGLQSFATGFASPVDIENCGDSRLFIVEQDGIIKILNSNGSVNATPFLSITNLTNQSGEQGLLGLAFHPNYASNGFFYLNYTNNSGDTVIARYSVSTSNPDIANTAGTILLTIDQPFTNHNGGTIKFGPDGYLYIGMGDGGSANDPGNRAQNINDLLGKMLRIDVNSGSPYSIPPTNPYVAIAGADEIWAIGLRNPWKFSFDRQTGDLWIADVGQGNWEEANKASSTEVGLNYGWKCYEGNTVFSSGGGCPVLSATKVPFLVTSHGDGNCSITGGFVYRGNSYPNFQGKYFFTDYCNPKIGMVDSSSNLTYSANFENNNFVTFGEDVNGELYVGSLGGTIYKLIDSSLSVTENNNKKFKVFPNPAKNKIYIENNSSSIATEFNLHDLSGKTIVKQMLFNSIANEILIPNLSKGLYLTKIKDNNDAIYTQKLLIE